MIPPGHNGSDSDEFDGVQVPASLAQVACQQSSGRSIHTNSHGAVDATLCRSFEFALVRAYRVAYDGRPFHGFQRQPDVDTVEDAVLDALVALDLVAPGAVDARSRPVPDGYAAAGRTDAGVSALAQTVAFDAPEWLSPRALNANLPDSIRVWAAADVSEDFHATTEAERRRYRYALYAPQADVERVCEALETLAGDHDLHNLTTDDTGTRRTVQTDVVVDGQFLDLAFEADGFPRHFVRRAAGLVDLVATGQRPLAFVDRVLDDEPLSGADGVPAAPPEPLVLERVSYPDVTFTVDEEATRDAKSAFRSRRVTAQVRRRVTGRIEDGIGSE